MRESTRIGKKELLPEDFEDENLRSQWQTIMNLKSQMSQQIQNLDKGLNHMLQKQEYDYLQAYNIFVKKKEKDLKNLVITLNNNNAN